MRKFKEFLEATNTNALEYLNKHFSGVVTSILLLNPSDNEEDKRWMLAHSQDLEVLISGIQRRFKEFKSKA